MTTASSSVLAVELALAMSRLRARLRNEQAAVTEGRNLAQISVLGRISERPSMTASELAQVEHVRQQSIADTVAILRRDGLLRGDPDPNDKRKTLLSLTAEGKQMVQSILETRGSWLAGAVDDNTTPSERDTLVEATSIIARLAATPTVRPNVGWHV